MANPVSSLPSKPPQDGTIGTIIWRWLQATWQWMYKMMKPAVSQTASFQPADEYFYPISAASAAVTVTLPLAINMMGKQYVFKKTDNSANIITINRQGTDTIDGATSITLTTQYQDVELVSDGVSTWHVINPTSADKDGSAGVIINGGMQVAQRAIGTLGTALIYGSVDRFRVAVTAGTVTAGTITQDTSGTLAAGRTGHSLKVAGASMGTTPTLQWTHYVEAKNAIKLKNATASFSCLVRHDVGSTITYSVNIYKLNAADNTGAVTLIGSSSSFSVATATDTKITLNALAMGDCSNGLRVDLVCTPGTTTTKNFYTTEWVLAEGTGTITFPYIPFDQEIQRCQRYFWKTFPYLTAPAQSAGTTGVYACYQWRAAATAQGFNIWSIFPVLMRIAPTITLFNPSASNAHCRDLTTAADCSAEVTASSEWGFNVGFTSAAGSALLDSIAVHVTADADL